MSTLKQLEAQAISAAKKNDWTQAITLNQEILAQNPQDIGALNRSGFAHLQLQDFDSAKQKFQQVLALEKTNLIALKQLANIEKNTIITPQFNSENFVEEPSKSKIIGLHRLANRDILQNLVVGQELFLKPKNRFISIETADKTYLGSLPEDISLHLSRLINTGNQYFCQLHTSSSKHCDVFIRESYQSPANRHQHSFSSSYQAEEQDSIGDDLLLLTDEVPLSIIDDESEASITQPNLKDASEED